MRAIVPAYNARPDDLAHVLRTCTYAGLTPIVVWQGEPILTGYVQVLQTRQRLGKGGAVKWAAAEVLSEGEPFVVVDADLHALEPEVLRRAATAACEGRVSRPGYDGGPGRLGRRMSDVCDALDVFPDFGALRAAAMLRRGGLIGPVQGYPHRRHTLASPYTGAGWDLDVLLRHLHAGDPLHVFDGGLREHRPGDARHLDANLRDLLDVAAGWVRW